MTTSVITASTAGNIEKMKRTTPRHRGTTAEPESRTIFTRREKRVQHELNPDRIAAQIGLKLITDFGGEFEYDKLVDFVSAMDAEASGVINKRVVYAPVVRTASIANVIHAMIEDGRLVGSYKYRGGQRVTFLMLSEDERSLRVAHINRQKAKSAKKKQRLEAERKQAQAAGQPIPMSRRKRRRQKARNDARAQAAQKKGRAATQNSSRRAA